MDQYEERISKLEQEVAELKKMIAEQGIQHTPQVPLSTAPLPVVQQTEKTPQPRPATQRLPQKKAANPAFDLSLEPLIWKNVLPTMALILIIVGLAVFTYMSLEYLPLIGKPVVIGLIGMIFLGLSFLAKNRLDRWFSNVLAWIGYSVIYFDILALYFAWNITPWYISYIMAVLFCASLSALLYFDKVDDKGKYYLICMALVISGSLLIDPAGFVKACIFFIPSAGLVAALLYIHKKRYGAGNVVLGVFAMALVLETIMMSNMHGRTYEEYTTGLFQGNDIRTICFLAALSALCLFYKKIAWDQQYRIPYIIVTCALSVVVPCVLYTCTYGKIVTGAVVLLFVVSFYMGTEKENIPAYFLYPAFLFGLCSLFGPVDAEFMGFVIVLALLLYFVIIRETLWYKIIVLIHLFLFMFIMFLNDIFGNLLIGMIAYLLPVGCILLFLIISRRTGKFAKMAVVMQGYVLFTAYRGMHVIIYNVKYAVSGSDLFSGKGLSDVGTSGAGLSGARISGSGFSSLQNNMQYVLEWIGVVFVLYLLLLIEKKYKKKAVPLCIYSGLVLLSIVISYWNHDMVVYELIGTALILAALYIFYQTVKLISIATWGYILNSSALTISLLGILILTPLWEFHVLVSIVFIMLAAAFIYIGMKKSNQPVRIYGFAMLFIFILKLLGYDAVGLHPLLRVFACIVAGIVCLVLSFVYLKKEKN